MSLELTDARIKITIETDAVLEAMHRASGRDRSEIAREVLHEWASKQIMESALTMKLLKANGISGSDVE